jgi:sorbin and SH3 domain-containing protein 1
MLSYSFQALYSYVPQNEDELELQEGDLVSVMEKCDDGWFVGMCLRAQNGFPKIWSKSHSSI